VIQEALTNALKYARDAAVAVQIDRRPDAVDVLITDDGGASESDLQGGRGLLGMRERVSVFGGTLDAGPQPHGGFRVHASLPIRERDG
jgi:signal transduction histidine kinase